MIKSKFFNSIFVIGPDQLSPSNTHVTWLLDQAVKLRADDDEIASDPPVSVVTVFKEVAEKYPNRIALGLLFQHKRLNFNFNYFYFLL